jgi:(p)ppGpp synthase/HD superfamily hydrolase
MPTQKKATTRTPRKWKGSIPPIRLGPRFTRAFLFAYAKHKDQARKASRIPYITHLMGVASLVLEAGGDEDLAAAALLHDVVEDCGGRPMLKQVQRLFGKRVAEIVDGCTDAYTTPKPPWRKRKESYIRRLKKEDAGTRLVSAADKLNNLRSILSDYREIGESVWSRFNGGRDGTLWYYRTLRDEFLRKDKNRIAKDLDRAVKELESLTGRHAAHPRPKE